ncbi:hypothetical protein [Nocardioides perillae]|uniref:GH26 domain-containing protein n=1 Tax=Nocardioides perillae TaxID=1119534 RepID=A0A7Y9UKU2_9ACTN|nr:hypothetical protein [Nocardioides perillae]NYG55738.1 hypothetical protein [Nocardioides perillae]
MRPAHRLTRRTTALVAGLLAATLTATAASAALAAEPVQPEPGAPWFGPELDWEVDDGLAFADRLGSRVSLLSRPLTYPLDSAAWVELRDLAGQSADLGAVSVVSLYPEVPLDRLTRADAQVLARELAELSDRLGSRWLVRFAPEMNGTWYSWGQRPRAYKQAFRTVATEVHAAAGDQASMVWAPNYGAGYPFGGALGRVEQTPRSRVEQRELDTNYNQRLDPRDDPYLAYYPGDRHVDWVGLSMYRFGVDAQLGTNTLPGPREVEQRLRDEYGYGDDLGRPSFYERFAEGRDQPMLISTSALYNPGDSGPSPLEIKQSWWRQLVGAAAERPLVGAIAWLELARVEPEVGERVEWGATGRPAVAAAMRADLLDSAIDLGPVIEVDGRLDPELTAPEPEDAEEPTTDGTGAGEEAPSDGSTSGVSADTDEAPPGTQQTTAEQLGLGDDALAGAAVGAAAGAVAVMLAFFVAWRQRRRRMRPPWL